MTTSALSGQSWLRRFSKLVCFSTLILIFIGGMVTSTNSGLAVPDWPTTYGHSMFAFPLSGMVGGILFEHGHRMIAAVVGFLTMVLAFWLPIVEKRTWVRLLGFAALSMVILQGLLGGLTVLLRLPTAISVGHAVLAQTFFIMTIILAYSLSAERRRRVEADTPVVEAKTMARWALVVVSLIFIQLILGAVMRHTHSGLAIPDFPRMAGTFLPRFDEGMLLTVNALRADQSLPPVTMVQIASHFAHRLGAVAVSLGIIAMTISAVRLRSRGIMPTVLLLNGLLVTQWVLAAFTIWTQKSPVITSLHVATGAAMLGVSVLLALRAAPVRAVPAESSRADAWLELTKPRIVTMVLVTTTIGYFLGGHGVYEGWPWLLTLLGTGLAAAGAAVLNNYLERDIDARMERTRTRALPSGRVAAGEALAGGVLFVLSGVLLLVWGANLLAGFLALLTAFLYVLVYTPLKRLTWLNTPVGAIPGALPPMIGWAAAAGQLEAGAWILFAILFAWQHPHFYSIAWIFREDYKRAGFKMLTAFDPTGRRVFRQAILFSLALIAVSVCLHLLSITGGLYLFGAVILGAALTTACLFMAETGSTQSARRVLLASVIYLPLLLLLIMVDAASALLFAP